MRNSKKKVKQIPGCIMPKDGTGNSTIEAGIGGWYRIHKNGQKELIFCCDTSVKAKPVKAKPVKAKPVKAKPVKDKPVKKDS